MRISIINSIITCILFQITVETEGQNNNFPRYWIPFTDKENTPYSVDHPEDFLSARAIERRIKQHIPVTTEDMPVDPAYIGILENMGLHILHTSKWLNGVIAATDDTVLINDIEELGFVSSNAILLRPGISYLKSISGISERKNACSSDLAPYGYSSGQIQMLHGEYLHQQGFEGQGMLIAILDAGFENADRISSLSHIWQQNQVVAEKDFVDDDYTLYNSHEHGTIVFSIIAGIEEDMLYGTSPQASFALVRTEEGDHEYLVEEYNWLCGAEFADSLGADIISSSLGYSMFDDTAQNHTYSDMDGKTTPISRAASIAASKGMVIVASAGNSGNDPWFYITAPADADSILAIGAVDSLGLITTFSSRGPSSDRRVKPDICAQGMNTVAQYPTGDFIYCAGTSCSAPVISGMVACLWQANPSACGLDIIDALQKAGHQYFDPDSLYGFGIPDMIKADHILGSGNTDSIAFTTFLLFPNPAHDYTYLVIGRPSETNDELITVTMFDLLGSMKKQQTRIITGNRFVLDFQSLNTLATGLYVVQVVIAERTYSIPLMKI